MLKRSRHRTKVSLSLNVNEVIFVASGYLALVSVEAEGGVTSTVGDTIVLTHVSYVDADDLEPRITTVFQGGV